MFETFKQNSSISAGNGTEKLSVRKLLSWETFWELFRFGLVGVANTLCYYLFYLLFLKIFGWVYVLSHLLAWMISVVFSFFMNCFFTFKVKPTWKRFILFPSSTLVNLGMTTFGTIGFVELLGWSKVYSPLIAGILAIPATFLVTKVILKPRSKEQL